MQITFIKGCKQTIIGTTKTKEHTIYVRPYIDGDENPKKLGDAHVEDFDFEPTDGFFEKGLLDYFKAGSINNDSSWGIVLPKDFVFPEGFTLKQLAKTLKEQHLDELKVPLIHITRR